MSAYSPVGTGERPTWSLPQGNVPDGVAQAFLRSDTPTGLSTDTNAVQQNTDQFRALVRAGLIVPTNQAAKNIAQSYGGWQAGDITPLGPMIEGKAGGLTPEEWQAYVAKARQESDAAVAAAEQSGYFQGMPTLQRETELARIANDAARVSIERQRAEAEIQQAQQRIDDARRAGDMDREQQETEFARNLHLEHERLSEQSRLADAGRVEEARQFDVQASGYMEGPGGERTATLAREQWQAEQQQLAYERAANPARAFENELARGAGAQYWNGTGVSQGTQGTTGTPQSPVSSFVQSLATPGGTGTTAPGAEGQPSADTSVRVPGFLQAFRQGQAQSTAGATAAPSAELPAGQAALGEEAFRQANQKTLSRLDPTQAMILQSYGTAGGVTPERQSWLMQQGRPKRGSVAPSYQLVS